MVNPSAVVPVASHLRTITRAAHDTVDAAFSRLDLADRADYARFLLAHAAATAAVEAVLSGDPTLPRWRPRLALLQNDLATLELAPPPPLPFDPGGTSAARLGALYVLEGSRLGGAVLVKRVYPGAPTAFLSARHDPGEWRAFLRAMDERGVGQTPDWLDTVACGASACFALYTASSQALPVPH